MQICRALRTVKLEACCNLQEVAEQHASGYLCAVKQFLRTSHHDLMQLSRSRLLDDDGFEEAVTDRRHFWWQWLHGNKRNDAQLKAAAAAAARAEAMQLSATNNFDVLAHPSGAQVSSLTATSYDDNDTHHIQLQAMPPSLHLHMSSCNCMLVS